MKTKMTELITEESKLSVRLDIFVSSFADVTRSRAQKLIDDGMVTVNGQVKDKNYKTRMNDVIEVTLPENKPCQAEAENIPLDIIYEDEDIIVVNKPKGMVVHPAAGHSEGTLVSALLYHCKDSLSGIGGVMRPGIVHRIDKDTSGLIVAAKNDEAHVSLSNQLKNHAMHRIYHAIAIGRIEEETTIDKPIYRSPKDRKKMAIVPDGKPAITHVYPIEQFDVGATYVKCVLETGRTHQIRVHLASINRPILGDTVYGQEKAKLEKAFSSYTEGQCLHAKELILEHPRTHEKMHFECDLPDYFEKILEIMREKNK